MRQGEDGGDSDEDDDDAGGDDDDVKREMELNELQEEDARIMGKIEGLLSENRCLTTEEVNFIRRSTLLGLDPRCGPWGAVLWVVGC